MHTRSGIGTRWTLSAAAAAFSLLLVGIAAQPAHAESVRDRQWHLDAMQADDMWKVSTGSGITIAVIDTGVDASLADLEGQVLQGKDYSKHKGDELTDHSGHGTSVAALIAATGARGGVNGSYGLAPGVKIVPIRMPEATEAYDFNARASYSNDMSTAIRYAADTDAQIINISMGQFNSRGKNDVGTPALAAAVQYALDRGKLIFAAAGNEGDGANRPGYPASTPGVVAVGSINEEIERSKFSEWGPEIDVTAPGENMIHACHGATEVCKSDGTSHATAIASASAALIWAKHPEWTNNQVLRVLVNTMKGNEKSWTRNDEFGYGIVRPRVALTDPGDPGPADEYPLPDLTAAAERGPATAKSPSAGAGGSGSTTADEAKPVGAGSADDTGVGDTWLALGVAATALLAAATAIVTFRARRRRATPALTAPPHPGLREPSVFGAPPPAPGGLPDQGQRHH
ncbi:type VII secretion-associated serine protease [Streptomyces pilosus]|uniref:type VII secretion-associated serine protease mycosin n=1 Tax=Streptomyces pilosus TaxID=28893 RepID=UPI0016755CC6|nr:type VII secretion-associated serine protease mycosin [Streptomyces pilosus]GGV57277.1 type VII secretion-associated serine protease [Streptomyces pilosus]